jgi:hypothetical protein
MIQGDDSFSPVRGLADKVSGLLLDEAAKLQPARVALDSTPSFD